jgi:stearoyl-CoA desaturase (delta-9 desaturase)
MTTGAMTTGETSVGERASHATSHAEVQDDGQRQIQWGKSLPFFAIHALALGGVLQLGWSWKGFGLALAFYAVRMFGVTAGYHRYFAHRSFQTSRVFQFVLAWLATSSAQKGVLWWAAHHRHHHRTSDQPGDVHSVLRDGFFWSHVGWILSSKYDATETANIRDFAWFPELRWLDKYHLVPPTVLGVGLFAVGGWWALLWGLFVSTTLLWHGTFTINSLSHMMGRRRYVTTDNSRNSFLLAIITLGEGWHNNHHYYQRAANQGFFWWELDITFYVLRVLAALGIVWNMHTTPTRVRDAHRLPREERWKPNMAAVATASLPLP